MAEIRRVISVSGIPQINNNETMKSSQIMLKAINFTQAIPGIGCSALTPVDSFKFRLQPVSPILTSLRKRLIR